jgi:O-antigen/teichoic acid export membrane protein
LHKEEKKLILKASTYLLFGFGLSQVIRFAGNLILTRLLVPELFGLVTTARVFIAAIQLFSDIGLDTSIIRSKRVDEPQFLNSGWTLQVIRNAILTLISLLIAFPVAAFYKEPVLAPVIAAISISCLISGFQSTSIALLNKNLDQKVLVTMEVLTQVISLASVVAAAYFFKNIWALLVGDFVTPVIKTIWSHRLNKGHPNRFALEKAAVREFLSFGKWILISTAIMFISSQIDRVILGKMFGMAWFGIYGIAMNLADMPKMVVSHINSGVIFPLFSKYSDLPREELRMKISSPRGKFLLPAAPLLAALACFGDYLIRFLFDQRYEMAAWVFPMLIVGSWLNILLATMDSSLYAFGKPMYSAVGNLLRFLYLVAVVPLANYAGGEILAVVAVSLNGLLPYIVQNIGFSRERISLLRQDAWASALFAASIVTFTAVRLVFGIGFPGQHYLMHNAIR